MEQQKLKVGDVVRYKGKDEVYRITDAVAVQTENGVVYDYTLKDCNNVPLRQFGDGVLEKVIPNNEPEQEKNEPANEQQGIERKSIFGKKNKKKKK